WVNAQKALFSLTEGEARKFPSATGTGLASHVLDQHAANPGEIIMSVKTMEDLFVATLKDIFYAEKQILKALPTMVKKANEPELKQALEAHRQETEGQVDRLDQMFKLLDVTA